jgi:hypothetical protein
VPVKYDTSEKHDVCLDQEAGHGYNEIVGLTFL